MLQLNDTPLAGARAHLDRLAVVGSHAPCWTWRQIHSAAVVLAARLDGVSAVCNLCDSRAGFLVTWLAALRRGCVQVLPPSGGPTEMAAMLQSIGGALVVADDPAAILPTLKERAQCALLDLGDLMLGGAPDADLRWSPPWDAPLVRLYTSGSTGAPEPQVRSLGQLALGAEALGHRVEEEVDGGLAALRWIVCSVPSQHMFGVEASVMLSLVHAIPVLDRMPLLPGDVHSALEARAEGAVWVATPLHLRALVRSEEAAPNCRAVIVSTMSLAPGLAAQAEARIGAPVLEIYGSTETGAVAMRRPAREVRWRALKGVRLESTALGTTVWGTHFDSPQHLADRVEIDADGGFTLLGRQGDLIKIGGRRASLAGLNLLLQDMPGLEDAVFYLPASEAPVERLVLIHAGAALDRALIEAWLRERVDPVFMPRTIIRVARLPRTATGKLPRAALDELYANWVAAKAAR